MEVQASYVPHIYHCITDRGVGRRSLVVAAIVGTILNLINQGDALLGTGAISWVKIGLTYIVPYCVSTYGAVSYRLAAERVRQMHKAA